MAYERFEDLPVWNAASSRPRGVLLEALSRDRFFAQPGDLRDQLRRAALPVSNNIADGFERGSTAELIAFLYIARGSAGEVRSMLCFLDRRPDAEHLKSDISNPLPNPVPARSVPGPTAFRTPTSRASATLTSSPAEPTSGDNGPKPSKSISTTSPAKPAPRIPSGPAALTGPLIPPDLWSLQRGLSNPKSGT